MTDTSPQTRPEAGGLRLLDPTGRIFCGLFSVEDDMFVIIELRRGMYGDMDAQVRGADARIFMKATDRQYDGIPEWDAVITGPGEYRVKEWVRDGFEWGPWRIIEA